MSAPYAEQDLPDAFTAELIGLLNRQPEWRARLVDTLYVDQLAVDVEDIRLGERIRIYTRLAARASTDGVS